MPVPVSFTGTVTAAPVLRSTGGGHAVANFTVSVTDDYHHRASNTQRTRSLTLTVTAWRDLAHQLAATLTDGTTVTVTGELRQRGRGDSLEVEADIVRAQSTSGAAHRAAGAPHLRLIATTP